MKLNVDTIYTAAVADEQHELADQATNGVFGSLADSTKGFTDRPKWEAQVRTFENEYMEKTQGKNADAKTKGRGKTAIGARWKYAKYLPKSWSSSKSVCGQAIEHGIKIDAKSGKTATEDKIKEVKKDLKSEKTPPEKFRIAMETASKVLPSMDDAQREDILKEYGIDPSKHIIWSSNK